uniref:Uncharacterized protein n=1 Tax=Megaselia scalaris TaxID=36166 RepID=T1H2X7_MEGSC
MGKKAPSSRHSSRNNLTSSPGGKPGNPSFTSIYSPHNIQNSPILEYSTSRQRSLSFTENYGTYHPQSLLTVIAHFAESLLNINRVVLKPGRFVVLAITQ